MHHGNAVKAKLKYIGSEGYTNLISDEPALPDLQTSRFFAKEKSLDRAVGDIIAECTFDTSAEEDPIEGGLGHDRGFCFAVVTYEPPMALSECTSTPSELTIEAAYGFELDYVEDPDEREEERRRRRRRRSVAANRKKRQSESYSWEFFQRDLSDSNFVEDGLNDAVLDFKDDPAGASSANAKLLELEQVQICRNSEDNVLVSMPRVTVNVDLTDADHADVYTTEECEEYYEGKDVASDGGGSSGGSGGSGGGNGAAAPGPTAAVLALVPILLLAGVKAS